MIEVLLVVGLPVASMIVMITLVVRSRRRRPGSTVVIKHLNFFGTPLAVPEQVLATVRTFIMLFVAVSVLPIANLLVAPFLVVLYAVAARSSRTTATPVHQSTDQVLEALRNMQRQAAETREHAERLITDLELRKAEVEQQTATAQALSADIDGKMQEYDTWHNLTTKERDAVIQAARQALSQKTVSQVLGVAVVSVVLNLVATLIWVLLGSPGKAELINVIQSFLSSVHRAPA